MAAPSSAMSTFHPAGRGKGRPHNHASLGMYILLWMVMCPAKTQQFHYQRKREGIDVKGTGELCILSLKDKTEVKINALRLDRSE